MARDESAPSLLFVSPVLPALTGNGLAMRAGMMLEVLGRFYRVSLQVVPIHFSPIPTLAPELARVCESVTVLEPGSMARTVREARGSRQRRWWNRGKAPAEQFDVVHVFRLASLLWAEPLVGEHREASRPAPAWRLDLDDVESKSHRRLAALARTNGDLEFATQAEEQAAWFESRELEVLPRMERTYVCSEVDRDDLLARGLERIQVVPNAVRMPATPGGSPVRQKHDATFTFLFLGTLTYYPNADAVRYFTAEIIPRIAALTGFDFRLSVVGWGSAGSYVDLGDDPRVIFQGFSADLAGCYAGADAFVIPLRAGGGTRIKALEAFSYRCPVVSTSLGVEGLEVRSGEHLLVADSPDDFARCCVQLISDPFLAQRLARNALELVTRAYSIEAVAAALAPGADEQPHRGS